MPLKPVPLPSISRLREMFTLNDDGRLINNTSRTSRRQGSFADEHYRTNYRSVYIDGKLRFAHRVVWMMVYGSEPLGYIDHINGDMMDNRPSNLREVSHSQNMFNKKIYRNNTSGFKGVHFRSDSGKWRATITTNKTVTRLGQFATKEEALAAVDSKRNELHGEYARRA